MQIVTQYGTMWARNTTNIRKIPSSGSGGFGVYILFDGSMPVYVGKGNIRHRVSDARRSKRRGQLWDRFSWYALADPKMMHDVEVLILRMLPRHLRALTRPLPKGQAHPREQEQNFGVHNPQVARAGLNYHSELTSPGRFFAFWLVRKPFNKSRRSVI
jgi:hypothetical protein